MSLLTRKKNPAKPQGKPKIPNDLQSQRREMPDVSFQMMTVRYMREQRSRIATYVVIGVLLLVATVIGGRWMQLKGSLADKQGEQVLLDQQITQLNDQIVSLANTAGYAPEEVQQMVSRHAGAFRKATADEINYERILDDLHAVDFTDAHFTNVELRPDGQGGYTIDVSGSATDLFSGVAWYTRFQQLPYVTDVAEWPTVSGGGNSGSVSWSVSGVLTSDVHLDRAKLLGIDLSVVPSATPTDVTPDAVPADEGASK